MHYLQRRSTASDPQRECLHRQVCSTPKAFNIYPRSTPQDVFFPALLPARRHTAPSVLADRVQRTAQCWLQMHADHDPSMIRLKVISPQPRPNRQGSIFRPVTRLFCSQQYLAWHRVGTFKPRTTIHPLASVVGVSNNRSFGCQVKPPACQGGM